MDDVHYVLTGKGKRFSGPEAFVLGRTEARKWLAEQEDEQHGSATRRGLSLVLSGQLPSAAMWDRLYGAAGITMQETATRQQSRLEIAFHEGFTWQLENHPA